MQKVIECEAKEVSPRILELIGSDESKDRQGDIVKLDGWDLTNYKKNPVFLWGHDYTKLPLGKSVKIVKDKATGKLKFHVQFADASMNPMAEQVYQMYKHGFLKATSVGFRPLEWEGKSGDDDMPNFGGNVYTKQELWELSACPVPANPNALSEAIKAGILTTKDVSNFMQIANEGKTPESAITSTTYVGDDDPKWFDNTYNDPTVKFITKPEETDNYIRIPVSSGHDKHEIRTIDVSAKDGIKGLYCVEDKEIITYLFSKDKGWDMDKAKKWVAEHKKTITQAEIKDELDYLMMMIEEVGMNSENIDTLGKIVDMVIVKETLPVGDTTVKDIVQTDAPYKLSPEDSAKIVESVIAKVNQEINKLKGKVK